MRDRTIALILEALALIVGHLSGIIEIIRSLSKDPDSIDLDELEKKVAELRRFNIDGKKEK